MANLTPIYVRAPSPIWYFFDLNGNILDDSYYAHFLTNELPYLPQPPLDSPFSTANPWTGGIVQFLANGALPNNLYFNDSLTYRIEIRQGNTSAAPLIYTIENFVAVGSSGGDDPTGVTISTENLISNPQFVDVFLDGEAYTVTGASADIEVATGWTLSVSGGDGNSSVTVSRQTVTADTNIQGQAPYFLRVATSNSGGGTAYTSLLLKQRFNNNGALFFSDDDTTRYVSGVFAAKVNTGTETISADLVSSSTNADEPIMSGSASVNWNQFTGVSGVMPQSTNPDNNSDAWVELQFTLPSNKTVDITSIQLVSQTNNEQLPFLTLSTERQLDQTWHYYFDEVLQKPKDTILTGWDFSLNPFQTGTSFSTVGAYSYVADQTILISQTNATMDVLRNTTAANRNCLEITPNSVSANNRFAVVQFIDPTTILPFWSYYVSSLMRARIVTAAGTECGIKMKLAYKASLPVTAQPPVTAFTTNNVTIGNGWTEILPKNDPKYILENAYSPETAGGSAFPAQVFEQMGLPDKSAANMTLAIIVYTTDDINVNDSVLIEEVSLTPSEIACASNPKTFEQTLQECQFFYEKSYQVETSIQTATFVNAKSFPMRNEVIGSFDAAFGRSFELDFVTTKRAVSTFTTYPVQGTLTANEVSLYWLRDGAVVALTGNPVNVNFTPTNWTISSAPGASGKDRVNAISLVSATTGLGSTSGAPGDPRDEAIIFFHYTANARFAI